jgi:hypothetical protein
MITSIIKSGGNSEGNGQRKLVKDSNGVLHCVYSRIANGRNNIFHSYSSNGTTWTEEAITNDDTYWQEYPSIAIDSSNNLHVVWHGKDVSNPNYSQIKYSKRTTSWSAPINLTGGGNYYQFYPSIAVDSSNYLHVTWSGRSASNPNYDQIRYIKYTTSWGSITDLTSENYNQMVWLSIAIDSSNNIHITWLGPHGSPNTCISYIKYSGSWGSRVDLDTSAYLSSNDSRPCIAIDSNDYLYVVYMRNNESYDSIYLAKFTTSWQTPEVIFNNTGYPYVGSPQYPVIAIDSNDKIHVLFADTYGIQYIYYVSSWSGLQTLTTGSFDLYPNILWAENNVPSKVQFIWTDYYNLNYSEIVPFVPIKRCMSFCQFIRNSKRVNA